MSGYPMQMHSLPPASDYHSLATPLLVGVPTPEIVIDGESAAGTDYVPHYLLLTVNPGDDVTGATRLMNGAPDVLMVRPEETIEIVSDLAVTDLYLIGVTVGAGGSALDIDTFTDYGCLIGRGDPDLADWLAQMKHLTFDSTENVRRISVSLTGAVDVNVKIARVQGVSHA